MIAKDRGKTRQGARRSTGTGRRVRSEVGLLTVNMGAAASDLGWHDVRDMAPTELADLVRLMKYTYHSVRKCKNNINLDMNGKMFLIFPDVVVLGIL